MTQVRGFGANSFGMSRLLVTGLLLGAGGVSCPLPEFVSTHESAVAYAQGNSPAKAPAAAKSAKKPAQKPAGKPAAKSTNPDATTDRGLDGEAPDPIAAEEDLMDRAAGESPFALEGAEAGTPPPPASDAVDDATSAGADALGDGEESVLPDEKNLRADDPDVPDSTRDLELAAERGRESFRIGPAVAVGLPHPLNWSLETMFGRAFSAAFGVGSSRVSVDDVRFSISNWDVRARWHPFLGAFHLGAAVGNQRLRGETSASVLGTETKFKVSAKSRYLTPHIGWQSVWDSGLTIGSEIGWQLAMSGDVDVSTRFESIPADENAVFASEEFQKERKKAEDAAESRAKKGIPHVKLLRVGWLF